MKISEIIIILDRYKKDNGDVIVWFEVDDGRSSWISSFHPQIKYKRYRPGEGHKHIISHKGY